MDQLGKHADHSWVRELSADPAAGAHHPNTTMRSVKSGHYVPVPPTPIPDPRLLIYSSRMAAALGISVEVCQSEAFVAFFAGNMEACPGMISWATPYALAIMGTPMVQQCPFRDGTGYGDGRAVSVGEVVVDNARWELQLKGGGTTPFCRGADGRAVLRSSVREFLASEAMDALGVSTTRALSLVVSGSETVARPWYSADHTDTAPDVDDPRLQRVPEHWRGLVIGELVESGKLRDPDTVVENKVAITTRVAPSFFRVGHIDLFARRAARMDAPDLAVREYREIVEHLLKREFPDVLPGGALAERALALIDVVAARLALLVAEWIRVGFCQGNFNSDNCLVAGRTMDYGPFGWIERYDPKFAKWTGSGEHFAFMNQMNAGYTNFKTLKTSLEPLFDAKQREEAADKAARARGTFDAALADTWRRKLGFARGDEATAVAAKLWIQLEPLFLGGVDWTIGWRELATVLEIAAGASDYGDIPKECIDPLKKAFYQVQSAIAHADWLKFVTLWVHELARAAGLLDDKSVEDELKRAAARMRHENPKYVPREWMLVVAYTAADADDMGPLNELHTLFETPYAEHPEMEAKYYMKATDSQVKKGGTAFMS
mmetsp:Transcript_16302/g.42317  ORF Transcript_16302/g.42317 Transcript_16302/m.42317 type:complete len:604 (-) Transcript_16302:261-2072(-)